MPRFLKRTYRVRKATSKSGHEITLPPDWINRRRRSGAEEGEDVEVLYDSIVVIVPFGVKVDEKFLAAAIEEG